MGSFQSNFNIEYFRNTLLLNNIKENNWTEAGKLYWIASFDVTLYM